MSPRYERAPVHSITSSASASSVGGIASSGSGLPRLDVDRLDHFAPLLGFVGDELAEIGRRQRKHGPHHNGRSVLLSCGRFDTCRQSTVSCWRRTRISATSFALGLKSEAMMWKISRSNSIIRWQNYRVSASRLAESIFGTHTLLNLRQDAALPRAMPHVLVNEAPGSRRIRASPVRNAFGGQVMGSTARLRRRTSGSGSPLKSIK